MTMEYEPSAAARIRSWQEDDPTLYAATLKVLYAIRDDPRTVGAPLPSGQPGYRLSSYGIPGRIEQYCITWKAKDPVPLIATVSTHDELVQWVAYQEKHGLEPE
ncbi:MAG: hypothetical protein V7738_16905 [Dietzia maris]